MVAWIIACKMPLLCDVVLFLFIHLQRPHCRILELRAKLLTWDQLYDFIRFSHIKVTIKFLRGCSFLYWPPLRWWIYVYVLVWSKMDQYVVPKQRHITLWQNLYDFCYSVHAISSSWEGAEIKSHMFEFSHLIFFLVSFSLILHIFFFLSSFFMLL